MTRVDRVKRPVGEPRVIHVLMEDEVRSLLRTAEYTVIKMRGGEKSYTCKRPTGLRNVAIVMFLLDSGLRAGEASRVKMEDVDQATGAIVVKPFRSGRMSKPRIVYLGKAARRAVWKYLATRDDLSPDDALFATDDGRPMKRNSFVLLVRRLAERAGIKDCHAHTLRHTFATEFIRNGGDVFSLQKVLGHSDLAMVRGYVETAQSDLERAFKIASPADRWRL